MKIRATVEQVQKMCALAAQASRPMGMGILHYRPETEFLPEDFVAQYGKLVRLDYVQGRMVKLTLRPTDVAGYWEASDDISSDYQSWIHEYPSYETLAQAAGAEVV